MASLRLYQILFSKQLNRNQWAAILLITLGCMCKESGKVTTFGFQADDFPASGMDFKVPPVFLVLVAVLAVSWLCFWGSDFSISFVQANLSSWFLLLVQMLCSVLAGVYNEVLLKGSDSAKRGVTTNLQRLASWGGLALGSRCRDLRDLRDLLPVPQECLYVYPVHCGEFCGADLGGKGRSWYVLAKLPAAMHQFRGLGSAASQSAGIGGRLSFSVRFSVQQFRRPARRFPLRTLRPSLL